MPEGLDDIVPAVIEAISGRVEDRYGRSVGVLGVLIWWAVS